MFTQESVMGIQKQKNLYLAKLLEQEVIKQDEFEDLVFEPEINAFHSNYLSSRFMDNINFGWSAWQSATAQAVPNAQQALHDRLLVKSIREHVESHIAEIRVNDLFDKGWLAAMKCIQNNIDMLEAQEPAND